MIRFKFEPNEKFGEYTPVELNVELPNDATMDEILEHFKVFLKAMTFYDGQVNKIQIVDAVNDAVSNQLDWRLPSTESLKLMYENLKKEGIGDLANEYYWSCCKSDHVNSAYHMMFKDGSITEASKVIGSRVRLVRCYNSPIIFKIGQETETGFIFYIKGGTIFECKKEDEPTRMDWDKAMNKFGVK